MSLRTLAHTEIENEPDYQRWQHEVQRAEWETEQQPPCSHPDVRLVSHSAYKNFRLVTIGAVVCRVCRQVVEGRIV